MTDLKPCPFCGHSGIHLRKKTQMRESVTGKTYIAERDIFHPVSLGWVGVDQYERTCPDYRFGVRFYCGRCGISPLYEYGEWHLPEDDEIETYCDLPHCCERFDEERERDTIERAKAKWNQRAV